MSLNQSIVEDAALTWSRFSQGYAGQVGELCYAIRHWPLLAPGEPAAERDSFGAVVQSRVARPLTHHLPAGEEKREAIQRLNPAIPDGGAGYH